MIFFLASRWARAVARGRTGGLILVLILRLIGTGSGLFEPMGQTSWSLKHLIPLIMGPALAYAALTAIRAPEVAIADEEDPHLDPELASPHVT